MKEMNPYNLDITRIVKYACLMVVAIIAIIFGSITAISLFGIANDCGGSDDDWDEEE